ncbi:MAG: hypothetical protein LBB41_01835 [Prevotellaceae bacterium]|nr:hypothetical protein [Prevotellaceae bacterium]
MIAHKENIANPAAFSLLSIFIVLIIINAITATLEDFSILVTARAKLQGYIAPNFRE